ncbi:hypothetical protein SDC9_47557 [bioreactor metagenome]|uniref:SLH domain-containing protein n=1 Tax=bioreactor metagenome TaxID=1076179 RepID=A0A644WCP3_9ZZZZ
MKIKKVFAIFLIAAMVLSASTVTAAAFTDVSDSHPYKSAIDFCAEKKFVLGSGADTFMPDASLTRAQLAVIWCRILSIRDDNHNFTDITSLNQYYDGAVIMMRGLGVLNGTSATKFSPGDIVTREQLTLLTMRTFKLGVNDTNDYQQYSDYALISGWAHDGVSSCINADVLEGLYDGDSFQPQKAVTRAEICKLIYNLSQPAYTVTIDTLSGGTITASPTQSRPGTVITLTVTPDAGMRLKDGTLKYNDVVISGTTFIMPAEDVLVTAEFEAAPAATLDSIAVTTQPTKTSYSVGETLDLSGMVITASYSDGSTAQVTQYTTVPADGSTLDTAGTITVTVSYTEDDVTRTTTFDVQVSAI